MAIQILGRFLRRVRITVVLTALVVAPLLAAACGNNSSPPPAKGGNGGVGGSQPQLCEDGSEQSCHLKIGENNGVLTCFNGTQVCKDSIWGSCSNGEVSSKKTSGKIAAALSTPAACINNPCDPTCEFFDEVPAAALVSVVDSVFGWNVGDTNNPSPLSVTEPCVSGEDCQSNSYCDEPITGVTCGHSKCEQGGPLALGCDTCVDRVCAADANCCALPPDCNTIAGAAPGYTLCSETSAQCKFYMTNTTQSCDSVCAAQGATCLSGLLPVGMCNVGLSFSHNCAAVGNADILCTCSKPTAGSWNSACVDGVKSECGAECSTNSPPDESGQCVQWQPGQTDSDCMGINLTVGVTCEDSGVVSVPVCNVGDTTAPAGVELVHYAPGSGVIGSCTPPGVPTGSCTTSASIAPGDCIDVTSCVGLTPNSEIMVNPPGAANIAECSSGACLDNWSIYQNGACQAPICKGTDSVTNFSRVNMFVMVDRSGSMGSSGMWTPAMNAFKQFFADPDSRGLNVALRFFPDDSPVAGCSAPSCNPLACYTPLVELGVLTVDAAPTDTHEAALIAAIDSRTPGGQTPTRPALEGALDWVSNFAATHPLDTNIVVLVTDGAPTQCNVSSAGIIALADVAFKNSNVLTYAVGLAGATGTLMNGIAAAGGTNDAFFVSNSATTTAELVAAMEAIRGAGVSCSLDIPIAAVYDPALTQVVYEPGLGPQQSLPQVVDVTACGNGWYYDDNLNPTAVELCPSTCTTVQGDNDICNGPNEFLDPSVYSCYLHETAPQDWSTASANCQAWGGELTSITSTAEQGFLNGYLGAIIYWTGGHDQNVEGSFEWIDKEPWGYTNWEPFQPDNGGGTQNCMAVSTSGEWYDYDCSLAFGYLCRKPVSPKQVNLELTCPQELKTTLITEVYQATCPAGKVVQWGYLTYDSIAPSDAQVVFDARTADTMAGLSSATYSYITTGQSLPSDTQVCSFGSGCEGDLYVGLGGLPDAQRSVLELRASLVPSIDLLSPATLNSWEVTYSCPDNE